MSKPLDKKALRVAMRDLRRRLADEAPDAAQRAARRLPVSRFSRFSLIGAYCAQGSELDPGPILQAVLELNEGRAQACLPVAVDKTSALKFRLWRDELLRLGLKGRHREASERLLTELFGPWPRLDADFHRWAEARRSSSCTRIVTPTRSIPAAAGCFTSRSSSRAASSWRARCARSPNRAGH